MLIVARAIAGIGGSGIVSGIMTIIAHVIPLKERAGTGIPYNVNIVYADKNRLHGFGRRNHGHFDNQRSSDRWCPNPASVLALVLLH